MLFKLKQNDFKTIFKIQTALIQGRCKLEVNVCTMRSKYNKEIFTVCSTTKTSLLFTLQLTAQA